jgi:hypothetical protein
MPALIREAFAAHLPTRQGVDPAMAARLVELGAGIQNRRSKRYRVEVGNGNGNGSTPTQKVEG